MRDLHSKGYGDFNAGRFYKDPHKSEVELGVYSITVAEYLIQYNIDRKGLPAYRNQFISDSVLEAEKLMLLKK